MQTITVDIINEKAIALLRDLELLKLIRVRRNNETSAMVTDWGKYKGAMTKQPLHKVDDELNKLCDE